MPRPQVFNLRLRSTDFDVFGHLNQAVYHELFEDARVAFLRDHWEESDVQVVLARSEVDYRSEILYGVEEVEIEVWPEDIGRSSFKIASRILRDGELAAEGRFVLVGWDPEKRSSRPLTEPERSALASLTPA